MLSTSMFAFSKCNGKIISSRGNWAMTVSLDACAGLDTEVAQKQKLFVVYRSEAGPKPKWIFTSHIFIYELTTIE